MTFIYLSFTYQTELTIISIILITLPNINEFDALLACFRIYSRIYNCKITDNNKMSLVNINSVISLHAHDKTSKHSCLTNKHAWTCIGNDSWYLPQLILQKTTINIAFHVCKYNKLNQLCISKSIYTKCERIAIEAVQENLAN